MRAGIVVLFLLVAGCSAEPAAPAATRPETAPEGVDAGPSDAAPPAETLLAAPAVDAPCDAPRAADGPSDALAFLCVHRTGHRGSESTLGVCPATGAIYAGGVNDAQGRLGVLATFDGARSWSFLTPSIQGQRTHRATLDPFLHVDAATCRVFLDDLVTPNCCLLSWSDNAGGSWDASVAGCMETDHQSLFTGPPVTSPTLGYANLVHRCAINAVATGGGSFVTTCQRSLDGGRTWLPPGTPAFLPEPTARGHYGVQGACDGAAGHGVADASGRIWLPKGCEQPWVAWSDDEGLTWARAQVSALGMKRDDTGLLDHDGHVALDAQGNAYYAWIAADRLPHLAVSSDRGESWQEVALTLPAGLRDAAQLTLDVAADGTSAMGYYGSYDVDDPVETPHCEDDPVGCALRLSTGEAGDVGTWVGHVSLVRGAVGGSARVWTATTGDAALVRGACGVRCQEAFDFQDLVMAPDGSAWAAFVDVERDAELVLARLLWASI